MEFEERHPNERKLEAKPEEAEQMSVQKNANTEAESEEPSIILPKNSEESETVLEEDEKMAKANNVSLEAAPAEVATITTTADSTNTLRETRSGQCSICVIYRESKLLFDDIGTYADEGGGSLRLLYDKRLEHPTIFFPYPKKLEMVRDETDITKLQKGVCNLGS